jgi:hypothetical protein
MIDLLQSPPLPTTALGPDLNQSVTLENEFEIPNLQLQVSRITKSIAEEPLRHALQKVLGDLVFLLDYLSLLREQPPFNDYEESVSILQAVRVDADLLVTFIEAEVLQLDEIDEVLRDTFDSTAYAIKHELRRIFVGELSEPQITTQEQATHSSLLHARGVLRNCFQHCVIDLVRVFDDSVTGARLYDDWRIRREQSSLLCQELAALIDLLNHKPKPIFEGIVGRLDAFRESGMQSLMYKDWQEYEALADRLIKTIRQGEHASDLLHQLSCYLETLLGHVRTRAVLVDPEPST